MRPVAISDAVWWIFLGAVVRDGERSFMSIGPDVPAALEHMERAGLCWLRPHARGYRIQPTDEGVRAAHRWASRRAKEAAREFGRCA